jgi:hypothetical protein
MLILFDVVFGLTEMRIWLTEDPNNAVWQTLMPAHGFSIFCSIVIMILKVTVLEEIDHPDRVGNQRDVRTEKSGASILICHPIYSFDFLCRSVSERDRVWVVE